MKVSVSQMNGVITVFFFKYFNDSLLVYFRYQQFTYIRVLISVVNMYMPICKRELINYLANLY